MKRSLSGKILLLYAGSLLFAGQAVAQIVIEEIVVTSQKREQGLQEVPIAVSAYDTTTLQRAGVRDIRDLQQLSPSLVLTSTQSETAGTTARIRGVGTTGDNLGLESSVAVFVDGVYRNRNSVALTDLGELERIEVLRGPQGTLFGKNASAGLINVITKGPDLEEFGGFGEASYGKYNEYRLSGGVTGPIVADTLGFRLDANWTQRDGFIEDIANGKKDYNDRDRFLVRGQLAGKIDERFSWRLIADYSRRRETCCAAVTEVAGPTAAIINALSPGGIILPPQPFGRQTTVTNKLDDPAPNNFDIGYISDVDEKGASLQFDWGIGIGTLTSITAWRDWESERSMDLDYSSADLIYRIAPMNLAGVGEVGYGNDFSTFSQELRLAGTAGSVDWLVGVYYVNESLKTLDGVRVGAQYQNYVNALVTTLGENPVITNPLTDGQGALRDAFSQDTDSIAGFTHNTLHVTDALALTLGLRYTTEEKNMNSELIANNPACLTATVGGNPDGLGPNGIGLLCVPLFSPLVDGVRSGTHTDREWSGTFVVDYDLNDSWMTYASYSRGYKAGGFNLDRAGFANPLVGGIPMASDLEFKPETVDSYEIGAKGSLWNERIRVNAAVYQAEFDNFQLNTFTGTSFIVTNLKKARTRGIELEGQAALTDGWSVTAGLANTDARYAGSVGNPTLAGRRLTNAPEWVITAATDYERPFGTLLGYLHLDYRFMSRHNTGSDLDPQKNQPGAAVWNGVIGIAADDRAWEVEVWGRNLLDKDYRQVVFDAPLQTGSFNSFLGDPRTIGVRGRMNF